MKNSGMTAGTVWNTGRSVLIMAACLGGATALGQFFHYMDFPDTNVVIVYILSVLLVARFVPGYGYGIAASVAATLTFNYFFTEPYFTLDFYDSSYFITFVIMTVTALITSALTTRAKKNEEKAREKEQISNTLYQMTHSLADAGTLDEIAGAVVSEVNRVLECDVACLCFERDGSPCDTYAEKSGGQLVIRRTGEKEKERFFGIPSDTGEVLEVNERYCDLPVHGKERILGILRIEAAARPEAGSAYYSLIQSMLENAALAIERYFNMRESSRSREEMRRERYRGNLLRSMSHDLRTPLAGIMGNSEILMGMLEGQEVQRALAEGVYRDADWLLSLVENILNLTRLEDGRIVLNKEPEVLEEILGSAVSHISKRYPGREIAVHIPEEFIMIPVDARLIEQVLVNLMDNAVKHTPEGGEIALSAQKTEDGSSVRFLVKDEGEGIRPADLPHIFELFYTSGGKSTDARRGMGIGLAICETIIKMHGGTVSARNRTDRSGAEISFEIPLEEKHEQQ